MRVCVLTAGEVACYEEYGTLPDCMEERHHHVDVDEALEGVRADHYRFVCRCRKRLCTCDGTTNFAVTEQSSNKYRWRKVPSAGYPVQQMVPRRLKRPHGKQKSTAEEEATSRSGDTAAQSPA